MSVWTHTLQPCCEQAAAVGHAGMKAFAEASHLQLQRGEAGALFLLVVLPTEPAWDLGVLARL